MALAIECFFVSERNKIIYGSIDGQVYSKKQSQLEAGFKVNDLCFCICL